MRLDYNIIQAIPCFLSRYLGVDGIKKYRSQSVSASDNGSKNVLW